MEGVTKLFALLKQLANDFIVAIQDGDWGLAVVLLFFAVFIIGCLWLIFYAINKASKGEF